MLFFCFFFYGAKVSRSGVVLSLMVRPGLIVFFLPGFVGFPRQPMGFSGTGFRRVSAIFLGRNRVIKTDSTGFLPSLMAAQWTCGIVSMAINKHQHHHWFRTGLAAQ